MFYQWTLRNQYREEPIKDAVKIMYQFFLPIPKRCSKKKKKELLEWKHTSKPDVSNLVKFAEDCLKKIIIEDDNQVWAFQAVKQYDEKPRTLIWVEKWIKLP